MLKRPNPSSTFRDSARIAGYVALPHQNWTRDVFVGAINAEITMPGQVPSILEGVRIKMLQKNRSNVIRFVH
jgi:hypothetical protein